MQSAITLNGLTKRFGKSGDSAAVDDVSLTVGDEEFLTLVGPSGCGKSTLMRLISGLETPTSGSIHVNGHRVDNMPTRARNIGFMFQGYALFKHMTVAQNIGFGLKVQKVSKRERRHRVEELLSLMGLEGLEERRSAQLSGGQQQWVALARALAPRPQLLLLDEPFGAVDAKVRRKLRADTRRWQKQLKIPTILVTRDQRDALELGDRVAVMNEGRIEQIDVPQSVYEQPANEFVARFIGRADIFATDLGEDCGKLIQGTPVAVMVRPEDIAIFSTNGTGALGRGDTPGTIARFTFLGRTVRLEVRLRSGRQVTVAIPKHEALGEILVPGTSVGLTTNRYQVFGTNGACLDSNEEA